MTKYISIARILTECFDCEFEDKNTKLSGVSSNSLDVKNGYLFCALSKNAIDYVPDAVSNGAIAVVSSVSEKGLNPFFYKKVFNKNILFIYHKDPKAVYHRICKMLYPDQPKNLCAVTGTNGKTSVCDFFRQICILQGKSAASIGTLGVISQDAITQHGSLTSFDAIDLHRSLHGLKNKGVKYAALEASSHGILQKRLHSARVDVAAFLNLSADHLDYHSDIESYFDAKSKLFTEVLSKQGTAVINTANPFGQRLANKLEKQTKIKVLKCLGSDAQIKILNWLPSKDGQAVRLQIFDKVIDARLGLFGKFQSGNLIVAVAIAYAFKIDVCALDYFKVKNATGRMQQVFSGKDCRSVFVDYAHNPDGLQHALQSLRYHFKDHKISLVFGCGGDRDKKKRPIMGQIAERYADKTIICDDNPRSEDPAKIRNDILLGFKDPRKATLIGCRGGAIKKALCNLDKNAILLIAGKGHEKAQHSKLCDLSFNDESFIKSVIANEFKDF